MSNEVVPAGQSSVVTVEFPSTREGQVRVRAGLSHEGKPIVFDPTVWDLLPLRTEAEYLAFAESCLEGIRDPIWLADMDTHWVVADGQDRLRAAVDALSLKPPVPLEVRYRVLPLKTTDPAHRIAEVRAYHLQVNLTDRQHFEGERKVIAITNFLIRDADEGIHRSNKWLAAIIGTDDSYVSKVRSKLIESKVIQPGLKILTREIKDGKYVEKDNAEHPDNQEVKAVAVAVTPRKIEFTKVEEVVRPEDNEEPDDEEADNEEPDDEEADNEEPDDEEADNEEPVVESFVRQVVYELLVSSDQIEPMVDDSLPTDGQLVEALSLALAGVPAEQLVEALTPLAKLLAPTEPEEPAVAHEEPAVATALNSDESDAAELAAAKKAFEESAAFQAAQAEPTAEPAKPGRKTRKPKQAENTPA